MRRHRCPAGSRRRGTGTHRSLGEHGTGCRGRSGNDRRARGRGEAREQSKEEPRGEGGRASVRRTPKDPEKEKGENEGPGTGVARGATQRTEGAGGRHARGRQAAWARGAVCQGIPAAGFPILKGIVLSQMQFVGEGWIATFTKMRANCKPPHPPPLPIPLPRPLRYPLPAATRSPATQCPPEQKE